MTPKRTATPEEQFEARVSRSDGCWTWNGGHSDGYSAWHLGPGRSILVHRWSYEHFVGPIPEGTEIDHLCRNRGCVNPNHLEPVTRRENVLRGALPGVSRARQLAKTHCPRGHEYSPENTYIYPTKAGGTYRMCKECCRLRSKGLTNGWADHQGQLR